MKTLLALAFLVAGIAAATATASDGVIARSANGWVAISYPADAHGYRFTTDTLGGNGHPTTAPQQSYRFITDTLGGDGHPKTAPQSYQFITDTLAPGERDSVNLVAPSAGFNWADAGIGAGAGVGALLVVTGATALVLHRRRRFAF